MFLPQCLRFFNILSIRIALDILFLHLCVKCVCVCTHAHKYIAACDMYSSVQRTENTGCPVIPRSMLFPWYMVSHGVWNLLGVFWVDSNSNNLLVSASLSPTPLTAIHLAVPSFFVGTGDPNFYPQIQKSYYHSKHLTNQAISSALKMTLMKNVKTEISKRRNGKSLRKSRIEVQWLICLS